MIEGYFGGELKHRSEKLANHTINFFITCMMTRNTELLFKNASMNDKK